MPNLFECFGGGGTALCLGNAEGTELVIDDALPEKNIYKLNIDGYTHKSPNLLQPTLSTTTSSNVTYTNNGDGTYSLSGSTSDRYSQVELQGVSLQKGKYKLVGNNNTSIQLYISTVNGANDKGNGATFNTNGCDNTPLYLFVSANTDVTGVVIKPMLVDLTEHPELESITYDDYEQYGLHSHGEKADGTYGVDVENVGKNLWDVNSNHGNRFNNDSGILTNNVADTRNFFQLKVNSFDKNFSDVKSLAVVSIFENGKYSLNFELSENRLISIKHSGVTADLEFNVPERSLFPKGTYTLSIDVLSCDPTAIGGLVVKDVQIEKGTQATPYKPYHEPQLVSVPLSAPLRSVNDIKDEIVYKDGKWWVHRRLGSVDLGTLDWSYRTVNSYAYFYSNFSNIKFHGIPKDTVHNLLCEKYKTTERKKIYSEADKIICADGTATKITQIQIKDSSYTDAATFKSSLSGQELIYELAEDTWTEISDVQAITMKEDTNIISNSDDAFMKMKYEV